MGQSITISKGHMDTVVITHIDNGTDIIISFSFEEDTQFGVGGFLILRTPQFEAALPPQMCRPGVLLAGAHQRPITISL